MKVSSPAFDVEEFSLIRSDFAIFFFAIADLAKHLLLVAEFVTQPFLFGQLARLVGNVYLDVLETFIGNFECGIERMRVFLVGITTVL